MKRYGEAEIMEYFVKKFMTALPESITAEEKKRFEQKVRKEIYEKYSSSRDAA